MVAIQCKHSHTDGFLASLFSRWRRQTAPFHFALLRRNGADCLARGGLSPAFAGFSMHFAHGFAVSPNSEASSKRQGDGQRFQKKAMKTTNQNEASATANVRPSSVSNTRAWKQPEFVRHCTNRRLSTEAVLNYLRTRLPRQYELAEVVGKRVWLDVSPSRKPNLAALLWAFIGTNGVVSGSIHAAASTRSAVIPPPPAPNIAPIFQPTFYPLESVNAHNIYVYTRSQAVASLNRLRGADHVSASKAWLLYGCFIRIVLDGNARDSKSTEAQELKFLNRIKSLILLTKTHFSPCGKKWW
jgi:hypothetical protein